MSDNPLSADLRWPHDPLRPASPSTDEGPAPDEGRAPDEVPPPRAEPTPEEPVTVVTRMPPPYVPGPDSTGTRFMIEAYDRLSTRLLDRLRGLGEDVDVDLAEVRSELTSLRQAVDALAERVQLRQLRATIDELRGDVSNLRRAVLEWPELEQVSGDVAGLRADLTTLLERPKQKGQVEISPILDAVRELAEEVRALGDPSPSGEVVDALGALRSDLLDALDQVAAPDGGGPSVSLEPVLDALAALRSEVLGAARGAEVRPVAAEAASSALDLEPLVEGLAGVQQELVALRRRIALRVGGEQLELSPEQLAALAEAVTARVVQHLRVARG